MPFRDYEEIAEPMVLPIRGKNYTIPPIGFADGVRLTEALQPGSEAPLTDGEFFRITLGDVYEQFRADNVPAASVTRAAMTNLAEYQSGRAAALIYWETDANPKALEDLVQAVLAGTTPRKTRRAGASTTQRPKRGSTTKTSPSS